MGRGGEEEQEDIRKLRIDLCEKELELEELRTEMDLKKKEQTQQDLDDIMKGGGRKSVSIFSRLVQPIHISTIDVDLSADGSPYTVAIGHLELPV